MRRKHIAPFLVMMLVAGAFLYAASGRMSVSYMPIPFSPAPTTPSAEATPAQQPRQSQRGMVDMVADDSYLIERGDSTIFILVGNFAAHHNGAVILADSAIRYSNQSFECFGNVLINQNTTYIYGERAEYNHMTSMATVYDDLVKIIDGDAVMYTYNCTFDTYDEVGEFYGGCYVEKGANLMESERGFYNTKTHDLIAVDNVEMRDETYQMTGDSVIFNTETENAQYFHNTNIWNDKDEYLYADEGTYTKQLDLHHLKRNAYILSPEHEIWSDTIEYYRTAGHIIGRSNIQIDDTTQKILGFADYGEWWDEPGNALFTRRPSMINYDPAQSDSLFLRADTLWMYTISALANEEKVDQSAETAESTKPTDNTAIEGSDSRKQKSTPAEVVGVDTLGAADTAIAEQTTTAVDSTPADNAVEQSVEQSIEQSTTESSPQSVETASTATSSATESDISSKQSATTQTESVEPTSTDDNANTSTVEIPTTLTVSTENPTIAESGATTDISSSTVTENAERDSHHKRYDAKRTADSLKALERAAIEAERAKKRAERDSIRRSIRTERDSIKRAERAIRDSIAAVKRAERDSLEAIERAVQDSIQAIKDSILRIKLDTIIAERRAKNIRIAEAEQERIERIKQKSEEHRRRKIDKAKARAAKRGKVYTGEDYTIDTMTTDSTNTERIDSMQRGARDTIASDSLTDTLALDSANMDHGIPADSVYKLIKAYRRVKMYRSDSQMVCDSLTILNTDSVIRLYINPYMWNDKNQINSDSMALYTANQAITRAHFMGDPIMGTEIDTMYYNQVKGKDMVALFRDGAVYRNDVEGNAQTIYYMQEEENSTEVTGFMYIESAGITFYFNDEGEMDKITYRQNPEYVLYPMDMIPETQERQLPNFMWHSDLRPTRDSVFNRTIRSTRRDDAISRRKPTFPITERINYDRRRLVENRVWVDRLDQLSPEMVEWRNSRTSYKKGR